MTGCLLVQGHPSPGRLTARPVATAKAKTQALGWTVIRRVRRREVLAVTSVGAPVWVDRLVLRRAVRLLRLAILKPCAPQARLTWRALHFAEVVTRSRHAALEARLGVDLSRMERRL